MNIEEQIKIVKNMLLHAETQLLDYEAIAIETLLTAYEKEKEKNKRLEKFIENGEYTWKQKYNETFEYFKAKLEKEKEKNKELEKKLEEINEINFPNIS